MLSLSGSFDEELDGTLSPDELHARNAGHPVNTLPLDAWRCVFRFTTWKERCVAARTCRAFHRGAMGTLREVCLAPGASLEAIQALAMLPLLERLDCNGHRQLYSCVNHFCTGLVSLRLGQSRLEERDFLTVVSRLRRLHELDVAHCSRVRGAAWREMCALPYLRSLDASNCVGLQPEGAMVVVLSWFSPLTAAVGLSLRYSSAVAMHAAPVASIQRSSS